MFEAVIFDWDGTLADTRKAILYSFHKALDEIGIKVEDIQIERLIGVGSAETFRQILRVKNAPFDEKLIQGLVEIKVDAEIEVSSQTKLFGGALELLDSLQGKVKLGLASMKNRRIIEHLLNTTRTKGFFEVVVSADDVKLHKPDPEIFLITAKNMAVKPENCVVMEDSIFGVEAAKAANMACIGIAQSAYSELELSKAGSDLVVASLLDISSILRFILE